MNIHNTSIDIIIKEDTLFSNGQSMIIKVDKGDKVKLETINFAGLQSLKEGKAACSSHFKSPGKAVGRWQETVFDTKYFPEAEEWALDIIKIGTGN